MAEYGLYGAMVRHSLPLPPALLRAAGSCRKRPMHHSGDSDDEADDSDGDHEERARKGSKDEPSDGRDSRGGIEKIDSGDESHKGRDSDEELMCPSERCDHKDEDSNLEGTSWKEDRSEKSTEKLDGSTIPSESLVVHAPEPQADLKTHQQELNTTSASKPGAEIADAETAEGCKKPRKREGTEKEANGDELEDDAIGVRTRWMLRMSRLDFSKHSALVTRIREDSFASCFHISRERERESDWRSN